MGRLKNGDRMEIYRRSDERNQDLKQQKRTHALAKDDITIFQDPTVGCVKIKNRGWDCSGKIYFLRDSAKCSKKITHLDHVGSVEYRNIWKYCIWNIHYSWMGFPNNTSSSRCLRFSQCHV